MSRCELFQVATICRCSHIDWPGKSVNTYVNKTKLYLICLYLHKQNKSRIRGVQIMRHFWSTSTLNEYSGTHTLISNTYSTIQLQYIHIFVSWSNGTSWRSFFLLSRCRLFVVVVVLFVAFFLNLKTALISVAFLKFNLTNQFLFFLHCCCKQKPYIYVYIYIFNKHTRMCLWCVGFFIFNFFYYFYIFLFESEIENDGAKKLMALAYFLYISRKKEQQHRQKLMI